MSAAAIVAELARQGIVPRGLCLDSRAVTPGDVFVAMPGVRVDGRDFIAQAVARGAAAVICQAGHVEPIAVPHVFVGDLARHLGAIADLVYGRPSTRLELIGVTGTNGKTSVTQWIAQGLDALGVRCGVVGTLGNGFPGALVSSAYTTPDAVALQRTLASLIDEGATACAMEVSSIGIEEHRIVGASFAMAVFTNLSRDHLDYHGDMATYAAAKAKLFEYPGLKAAVLNLDDAFGRELAGGLAGRIPIIGYTLEERGGADRVLAARGLTQNGAGIAFQVDGQDFSLPVVGRFNAANALATIGALLALGHATERIAAALRDITPPPGRMQTLGGAGRPLVVVDYAHTPDALEKALATLRETATARHGRLICVFGCGGERDPGKRSLMGSIAEKWADRVWLTNDNPRGESPQAILDAIRTGMNGIPSVEPDRKRAIAAAVAAATAADVVLLAGKGHEPYQEIAGERLPFSDLDTAQAVLETWR